VWGERGGEIRSKKEIQKRERKHRRWRKIQERGKIHGAYVLLDRRARTQKGGPAKKGKKKNKKKKLEKGEEDWKERAGLRKGRESENKEGKRRRGGGKKLIFYQDEQLEKEAFGIHWEQESPGFSWKSERVRIKRAEERKVLPFKGGGGGQWNGKKGRNRRLRRL